MKRSYAAILAALLLCGCAGPGGGASGSVPGGAPSSSAAAALSSATENGASPAPASKAPKLGASSLFSSSITHDESSIHAATLVESTDSGDWYRYAAPLWRSRRQMDDTCTIRVLVPPGWTFADDSIENYVYLDATTALFIGFYTNIYQPEFADWALDEIVGNICFEA